MEALVQTAQKPLKAAYKATPDLALVTDHTRTGGQEPADPFHLQVEPMDGCGIVVPVGTHAALGDLLCAALAACQDSAFRMVANSFGIELTRLEVRVTATVDVRGSMAMDPAVPVGFQGMTCHIDYAVAGDASPEQLHRLQFAATRCCIVK
ncbi:MAG: OsmC family protein [Krumholzibacteria bacterium]|nr:OsmC family protein [Candidatus Krumholzibacteria bacterium]